MTLGWYVGCIVLDIGVILTNLCEEIYILRGWNTLDRIDHLLLSLSVSDFFNGVATLGIDSWVLARSLVLDNSTLTSATPLIVTNSSVNGTSNVLVSHHRVIQIIFETVFLFTVFVSVLHVTAVAVERIYAVRFPRKYYIFTKFKTKCLSICMIWVISLILTPSFIFIRTDKLKGRLIRGIALAIIVVAVFCIYSSVAYFLFQQHRSVVDTFTDSSLQLDRLRRLTIMCIFIGISFVVCIAPITIGYLYEPFSHEISSIMVTLNSLINPCIYFAKVYQDTRNKKKPEPINKELIQRRAYGYTLTTIIDEAEVKENYKNGSPLTRKGTLLGRDSPLSRGSPRCGPPNCRKV